MGVYYKFHLDIFNKEHIVPNVVLLVDVVIKLLLLYLLYLISILSTNKAIICHSILVFWLFISEFSKFINNDTSLQLRDKHEDEEIEQVVNHKLPIVYRAKAFLLQVWILYKSSYSWIRFPCLVNVDYEAVPRWVARVVLIVREILRVVDEVEHVNHANE